MERNALDTAAIVITSISGAVSNGAARIAAATQRRLGRTVASPHLVSRSCTIASAKGCRKIAEHGRIFVTGHNDTGGTESGFPRTPAPAELFSSVRPRLAMLWGDGRNDNRHQARRGERAVTRARGAAGEPSRREAMDGAHRAAAPEARGRLRRWSADRCARRDDGAQSPYLGAQ
jgi:hypothetical protein